MASLEKIGLALQGFGAGVAGRGPEFVQQLDDRRKAAMAQDAVRVQQLLSTGNTADAVALLSNRIDNINRLGGDPSDTQGVLNKLNAGDTKGALNDVSAFVEGATRAGYIKPPDYGSDMQTSAPKKVIGTTASGAKVNGSVSIQFDPTSGGYKAEFIPDVGSVDPNDPIVSTENVDVAGLTGEQRIGMQTEASSYLKGEETRQQKQRVANEKRIVRQTDFINEAMAVSEQIPTVRRAIKLLEQVKTGNVGPGLMQWAKQTMGIQAADEAELSNALSVMVLQQLRPTFGAQFTKAEGDWLKTIQPNLGKSNEGNLRILKQLEGRLIRQLKQGMRYADSKDTYDQGAYDYISAYSLPR